MLAELNRQSEGFVEIHRDGAVCEVRMVKPKVNAILRRGLAYRAVPKEQLAETAWRIARRMTRGAPLAQQALKEALRAIDGLSDREAMNLQGVQNADLACYARMLASDDMIEGQRAFLEKREPNWTGHLDASPRPFPTP